MARYLVRPPIASDRLARLDDGRLELLGRANKLRARAVVIIGSNQMASGMLTVKDLAHGTQSEVAVADLEALIRKLLD